MEEGMERGVGEGVSARAERRGETGAICASVWDILYSFVSCGTGPP